MGFIVRMRIVVTIERGFEAVEDRGSEMVSSHRFLGVTVGNYST
jgi:hypothetical protein